MGALALPRLALDLPLPEIEAICRKLHVKELAVFGSVLSEEFRPDSDVDFLASFENSDPGPWLSYLTELQQALTALLGRPADVAHRPSVEKSRNWIRRREILSSAQPIYASR
ncbi:MAG: nucleotidyltransferase domain-containing protein [Thermoanaerobaculia bacterium]